MNRIGFWGACILSLLVLFVSDFILASPPQTTFLPAFLFWTALGQGVIALNAAADIAAGKWIGKIRTDLDRFVHTLAIPPVVFFLLYRHISFYPWTEHPTAWLNTSFFAIRNVAALLMVYLIGLVYTRAASRAAAAKRTLAVLYIFVFVICQSLLAFDLVMSLDYPFINTLFGGYFFIEALFLGIAAAGIIAVCGNKNDPSARTPVLRDISTLIMGFSLLWAGLFFSQYLVIWYGNIPEETAFIARRLTSPSHDAMGIFVLLALFAVPFAVLIPKRMKERPFVTVSVSLIIFCGILVERVLLVRVGGTLSIPLMVVQFLAAGIPFIYLWLRPYQRKRSG